MLKKINLKKILISNIAVGLLLTSTFSTIIAEANEANKSIIIEYETNAYNLKSNFNKNSELCHKLQKDADKSSTQLNEKIEKELNKIGVFDSDIVGLDQNTVDELNNAYLCSVKVMYYEENLSDGTLDEMSPDKIDELIKKVYEDKAEKNISSKDITTYSNPDDRISPSGKMRQVLFVSQQSKNTNVKVSYTTTWLERPTYKKTDVAGVYLKNATPINSSWEAHHRCEYTDHYNNPYQVFNQQVSYTTVSNDGMAAKFQLYDGEQLLDIKDESFSMSFYCKIDNKTSMEYISAFGEYWHCKTNKNYSPGISINTSGISLSLGVSVNDVYSCIGNNPSVIFKFLK